MEATDFRAPDLRVPLTFLGVPEVRTVAVEQTAADENTLNTNLAVAQDAARAAA